LVGVDLDQGDVGLLVTADHLGRVPAVVLTVEIGFAVPSNIAKAAAAK
jgi:hypothetical protein